MKELIERLNHHDEEERLYALYDIQNTEVNDEVIFAIINRLNSEKVQAVRNAIVDCLKSLELSNYFENIFELFSSEDAFLRNAAVEIFASKGEEAVGFLTSKLDHANQEVRKLIIDSLTEIGSPESVMAIRAALHDPSINVRITAVECLGRLNDTDSIPEMIEAFRIEGEPMMKASIINTIVEIGDRETFQEIKNIIENEDPFLKPYYFTDYLNLIAKFGNYEEIIEVLKSISLDSQYLEDYASFITKISDRFPDIKVHPAFRNVVERLSESSSFKDLML